MYGKNGSNYSEFLNKEFDDITYQDYISAPHRYLRTQDFARMLFYKEIYEKIIDIQGEIHLLGVANGSTLFILAHLAEILEPLNTTRRIVGFDLFGSLDEAYYPITSQDNEYYENNPKPSCSSYITLKNQVENFNKNTRIYPEESLLLVKGDASVEYSKYCEKNYPIISSLFLHIELYEVEKIVMNLAKKFLSKNAIVCSSTLGFYKSKAVTKAVDECFNLGSISIKRSKYTSKMAYFNV